MISHQIAEMEQSLDALMNTRLRLTKVETGYGDEISYDPPVRNKVTD